MLSIDKVLSNTIGKKKVNNTSGNASLLKDRVSGGKTKIVKAK